MSSTTRPSRNGERDAYYTPDAVARACIRVTEIPAGATVLEPSVGGGAFIRALPGRVVTAIDVFTGAPGSPLSAAAGTSATSPPGTQAPTALSGSSGTPRSTPPRPTS